ncbi:hypothetical protein AKJ16_DCAP17902 [Drosera capensis]
MYCCENYVTRRANFGTSPNEGSLTEEFPSHFHVARHHLLRSSHKNNAEQRFGGEKSQSQSQRRFASASTMEDIFVFDSTTDDAAAAAPPPPGKRKGDAARSGARRRGALEDISNAQVKPRQLNRGEKEKPGLAIFASEQNQIELLLKEKVVLKKEIADREYPSLPVL